nr:hypothetical protein [bacterium endosymbiont of Pedicinus badii]
MYLLYGRNYFLLQKIVHLILRKLKKNYFSYRSFFILEKASQFKKIFIEKKNLGLFEKKKIILVLLKNIDVFLQIFKYIKKTNKSTKIIFYSYETIFLDKKIKNIFIKKENFFLISCEKLKKNDFLDFIKIKFKEKSISLKETILNKICYFYEGNLQEFEQFFKQIIVLKNRKKKVNCLEILSLAKDSAIFTIEDWIFSVLNKKYYESLRILKSLYTQDINPMSIIYSLQKIILLFIKFMKNQSNFYEKSYLKNVLLIENESSIHSILKRIKIKKIKKIIRILIKSNLLFKKTNDKKIIWNLITKIVF